MAYTFKHGDRPLEGYTIQRGIGRGGFGEVYYAVSDGGREVALKYLRDNSEIELRGVSHCINLKSPHLVSIFDVKKNADGEYFIIMEHIAGPSLCELLIAEPNGLGKDKAAFFLREIGRGLADLHDRGIVHRDMKPANIFYEDGHVKIGDYGLSKFISVSRHSAQTTSVGTVHYMAPEVGSGNYHRGIDIYALGVILYEMLLGRVPFEGSSMGEVLMKHLTEQPEVAGLPEPFGKVIRKALEKDPKDRYQNVNEMIDDMLEVGDVRNSLAGFNPNTITIATRRVEREPMRTPVPSPNPTAPRAYPPPPPPPGSPVDDVYVGRLPRRVEQRLQRINDKVSRKMDKLAGRPRRRRPAHAVPRPGGAPLPVHANSMTRFQRWVLALVITVGICIGMGLLTGLSLDEDTIGASTGMMVFAAMLGVRLSRRVLRWLGSTAQPEWVAKLATVGCCALPMTVACVPLTDTYQGGAFALLIGMLAVVLFCDIEGRFESGARGELSFGRAFSMGLFGLIACAIAAGVCDVGPEENFAMMGAGVAGALSLLIEALAWCLPTRSTWAADRTDPMSPPTRGGIDPPVSPLGKGGFDTPVSPLGKGGLRGVPQSPNADPRDAAGRSAPPVDPGMGSEYPGAPFAIPVQPGTPTSGYVSSVPLPPERSIVARGFWSIFAFVMLGGMVFSILNAALVHYPKDEHIGLVAAAAACGSLMLFAAQKLTTRKRAGFWKETICPFLIAAVSTGMAALISFLVVYGPDGAELALALTGLVAQSVVFLSLCTSRFGLIGYLFGGSSRGATRTPFVLGAAIGTAGDAMNLEVAVGVDEGILGNGPADAGAGAPSSEVET